MDPVYRDHTCLLNALTDVGSKRKLFELLELIFRDPANFNAMKQTHVIIIPCFLPHSI